MKRTWRKRAVAAATSIAMAALSLAVLCGNPITAEAHSHGRNIVLMLDPGHGGDDVGATRVINGTRYYERDINLKITKYCKEELERVGGYTLYMTRTDNTSPNLNRQQRAEKAEAVHADALISFHINATNEDITTVASGAMVYAPNKNYRSEIHAAGESLGNQVLSQLTRLGLTNNGIMLQNSGTTLYPDGSVADYMGINYWSKLKGFPGVIIEHAFVNNVSDVTNYLSTEEQLRQLGVADAWGIMDYYNQQGAFLNPLGGASSAQGSGSGSGSAGAGWVLDDVGWWYRNADGSYPTSSWLHIGGKWYWFDEDGYMAEGWRLLDGTWYYLTPGNGAMVEGWLKLGDTWYYLNPGSGAMAEGWQLVNGTWYYLNPGNGAMAEGWLLLGDTWYYLNPGNGAMAEGWLQLGDTWYYLNPGNGAMVEGWLQLGDTWYYLNPGSGAMATDTYVGANHEYYVDANGVWVQDGATSQEQGDGGLSVVSSEGLPDLPEESAWVPSGNLWWYRHADGSYTTSGWEFINGHWYYFDASGWMAEGWQQIGDAWYYLTPGSGAMAEGWQQIGGTWYYLMPGSGVMAANTEVDGHWLDASGAMAGN